MPPSGPEGRILLTRRVTSLIRLAIAAIILCSICGLCIFYWWRRYKGEPVIALSPRGQVVSLLGAALILVMPQIFLDLLFPLRLVIEPRGITLIRRGRKLPLRWDELRGITMKLSPGGFNSTATYTVLAGPPPRHISIPPFFSVSPTILANYIRDAQAAVLRAAPLPIRKTITKEMQAVIDARQTRKKRIMLFLVVLLLWSLGVTAWSMLRLSHHIHS